MLGDETLEQVGEQGDLARAGRPLEGVHFHLHLLGLRPKKSPPAVRGFPEPGAAIFDPHKGFGVRIQEDVCRRRGESVGRDGCATRRQKDGGQPNAPLLHFDGEAHQLCARMRHGLSFPVAALVVNSSAIKKGDYDYDDDYDYEPEKPNLGDIFPTGGALTHFRSLL